MSFSGVWAGSVAAGLLDGMAGSGSAKTRFTKLKKRKLKLSKSKHEKVLQKHQVQRHSMCRSVGRSLAHSVLPLSWENNDKWHEQRYSKRKFVRFEWEIILSVRLTSFFVMPFTHPWGKSVFNRCVCVFLWTALDGWGSCTCPAENIKFLLCYWLKDTPSCRRPQRSLLESGWLFTMAVTVWLM